MSFFKRRQRPAPAPQPSAEQVAEAMHVYIADLLAGDAAAVEMAGSASDGMPVTGRDWVAYPTSPYRLERLTYFGGPSPDELPDEAVDTFIRRHAA
ncbi:hypothetical protein ACIPW5_11335 [Streptomyces sp. NPDC090077]|uniref:hypothetical protein n=1 Tax=Streptomyces sp. NPDC090077 TaxID=3365938 RepID=UPI0038002B59